MIVASSSTRTWDQMSLKRLPLKKCWRSVMMLARSLAGKVKRIIPARSPAASSTVTLLFESFTL